MYSIKKTVIMSRFNAPERAGVLHRPRCSLGYFNKNNLHTVIKDIVRRYSSLKDIRVCIQPFPLNEIHPWKLGAKALHDYCYISAETILCRRRFINAAVRDITFVSNKSRVFCIGSNFYKSRKLQERFLFNPAGITEENSVKIATPERAIADMLYFNPRANFDRPVDWEK